MEPVDRGVWRGRVGARVGPHRLVRPVGGGEDTEVWLADGPSGPVAVKRLRPRHHPTARLRLAREHAALSRLAVEQTPQFRVAAVVDVGDSPADPWLAVDWVHGVTLAAVDAAALPVAHRLAVLHRLAEGLCGMHRVGVVHRDLKPDNVMIAADGALVIIDFAASALDGVTFDGRVGGVDAVVGTPGYMAPEAGRGAATPALDVYAFGVTAAEVLRGVGDAVSSGVREILAVARAPDPADRPSMADLAVALGAGPMDPVALADTSWFPAPVGPGLSGEGVAGGAPPTITTVAEPFDQLRQHALDASEAVVGHVRAEAGWGKTFTLDRAAERAASAGWLVVRSACTPARTGLDAVAAWLVQLDRATAIDTASAPEGARSVVARDAVSWARTVERRSVESDRSPRGTLGLEPLDVDEMGDVLFELVELAGPTLLVLDDVHLADDIVIDLIARVTGRPAVAVVAAAGRPDGPDEDDLGAIAVAPRPLDDESLVELATRALGRAPTTDEQALLVAVSGRHPVLVFEAAAAVRSGDTTDRSTVAELARRRVERLANSERDLVRLLAVGGESCWPELLGAAAANLVPELVVDGLIECRMGSQIAGVIEMRFVHAAVRDAIDATVTGARRVGVHAELTRQLIGVAPADAVAPHAVAAALGGVDTLEPDAIELSCVAAQRALDDWATDRASRHVAAARAVVELGHQQDSTALDELVLLDARIHLTLGQPDDALSALSDLRSTDAATSGRARRLAVDAHLARGAAADGLAIGLELIDEWVAEGDRQPGALAELELQLARAHYRLAEPAEALVFADRAAKRVATIDAIAHIGAMGVGALAAAELAFGGAMSPAASHDRSVAAWHELRQVEPRRWVREAADLVDAIFWTDWELASELAADAASTAEALGATAAFADLACLLADFSLENGDPDACEAWLDRIVGTGGWQDRAELLRIMVRAGRDPLDASRAVSELLALADSVEGHANDVALVARVNAAAVHLWHGRVDAVDALRSRLPDGSFTRVLDLVGPAVALLEGPDAGRWASSAHVAGTAEDAPPPGSSHHLDIAVQRYLIGDRAGGDDAVRACVDGRRALGLSVPTRLAMASPQYLFMALGPPDVNPPLEWFRSWCERPALPGVWVVHRAIVALVLAERGETGFDRRTVLAVLDSLPDEPGRDGVAAWVRSRAAALSPQ